MTKVLVAPSSGGFAHTLLRGSPSNPSTGEPWAIGSDFKPPTPAGQILPKIAIDRKTFDQLWNLVVSERGHLDAELTDESLFRDAVTFSCFENGITDALKWFVSSFQFDADVPNLRKDLRLLENNLVKFLEKLPNEFEPLGNFLSETYLGETFLEEQQRPDESLLISLQNSWRERDGLTAMKDAAESQLKNVRAAILLLGKSKTLNYKVKSLVRRLAHVWCDVSGKWPYSYRDEKRQSIEGGAFADFVRTANDVLPHPFRIGQLDRSIRETCEKGQ